MISLTCKWDFSVSLSVKSFSFCFSSLSQSYHVCTQRPQTQAEEEEEVEVEEAEELGHVDTYADYRPSKCERWFLECILWLFVSYWKIYIVCTFSFAILAKIGISHPDRVVETNTLSSVPPPDITYSLSVPETTINSGQLSALQLEAIIYACQVPSFAFLLPLS